MYHDVINRYLADDWVTPRLVWENIHDQVVQTPEGYLVFDDTVRDKRATHQIERARRPWRGNAHGVINGIGVVTCVYVNPHHDAFWIIDYRRADRAGDGKRKRDHGQDMLANGVDQKRLALRTVVLDSWYATTDVMRTIAHYQNRYSCPLKGNRQVDDPDGQRPYQRADRLIWHAQAATDGKGVQLNGFPQASNVKLFRVVRFPQRTDYVVTNDTVHDSTVAVHTVCGWRWKIAQLYRETNHVTGIEGGQCRKARIVRKHSGGAILVWVRLKQVAHAAHTIKMQLG